MEIPVYEYDEVTGKAVRHQGEHYPDSAAIPDIISSPSPASVKINKLKAVYVGEAEHAIAIKEDAWWVEQNTIQTSEDSITTIDRLESLELVDSLGGKTPYTNDELKANKEELDALLLEAGFSTTAEWKADLNAKIKEATTNRDGVENLYPWVVAYRGVTTKATRPVATATIPRDVLKQLIAKQRDAEIRNVDDTLADLAKMNSLLFSVVATIYSTLTPTAINKIPAAEKAVIDYAIKRFTAIQTRGDRQLATEGTKLIDKLFDREVSIADMVDLLISKG